MFETARLQSIVCCSARDRAEQFYVDTLGLRLKRRNFNGFTLDVGGADLCVCEVPRLDSTTHTVVGFEVPDAAAAASALRRAEIELAAGLVPGMTGDRLVETPDGGIVGWFRDPDGNLLSIVQNADGRGKAHRPEGDER